MASDKDMAAKTFFVPGAPLAGTNPKEGSRISLEVVSVDPQNGDVEVRLASDESMDHREELKPMLEDSFAPQGPMTYG